MGDLRRGFSAWSITSRTLLRSIGQGARFNVASKYRKVPSGHDGFVDVVPYSGGRANASNFVHLSGAGHDFAEKHRVQSRRFAFARDAVFSRMLLEQAERQLAHQREI